MKYTIKQIVRKPITIQGRVTEIITMLVDDEAGKELKLKVWKSQWTETFKEGIVIEANTEIKKDRDGFDELWLVNPNKGKGFVPRFNPWNTAYQLAVQIALAEKKTDFSVIDGYASKFKIRLESGPVVKTESAINLEESGLATPEPEEEVSEGELEL